MGGEAPLNFRLGEPRTYFGMRVEILTDTDVVEEARQHTFDPTDIIVASYPKSGKNLCDSLK